MTWSPTIRSPRTARPVISRRIWLPYHIGHLYHTIREWFKSFLIKSRSDLLITQVFAFAKHAMKNLLRSVDGIIGTSISIGHHPTVTHIDHLLTATDPAFAGEISPRFGFGACCLEMCGDGVYLTRIGTQGIPAYRHGGRPT